MKRDHSTDTQATAKEWTPAQKNMAPIGLFEEQCKRAGIRTTSRQWRKFSRKTGLAFKTMRGGFQESPDA